MTVQLGATSVASNPAGTSAASVTVTKPSETAEGYLMIAITSAADGVPTPPTGWTHMGNFGDTFQRSDMYKKRAGASEPADYTWTFTASSTHTVSIATFMGDYDILQWDARFESSTAAPQARRTEAARDSIGYSVLAWRDGATTTITGSFGVEQFDTVSNNTGASIFRGQAGFVYGPPGINDIVNVGDALPGITFTSSGGVLDRNISWQILVGDKEPDNEDWSSTNGDFAVDLKLDEVAVDTVGSITTKLRCDATGEVAAFNESAENAPSEVTENLADGLVSTKWLAFAATGYVEYDFGAGNAKTIRRYRMTSANDAPARDPMNWTLQGSNNGTDYTVIDTRANESFANRAEIHEYKVASPGSYRYYRLNITANKSSGATAVLQLAEWRLSTCDVWEDITTFVNEEDKIRITRGFQGASGRHDFSRAYFELNNTDGRFSTRNQGGAYFGALQRNTQTRISKAFGTKSLQLQGDVQLEGTNMAGDCVRTPLTKAMQITGDIDVRIDLEPESWRDEQMLCGISTQSNDPNSAVASWTLHLDDNGQLNWLHSPIPGTVSYLSTQAVPQATRQAVRVTVDVDNGAGGSTATFYTASTIAGPWTQLGDAVTITTGTTSIGYTGGALCVGHVGSKDERGIHGLVYGFELRTGIDGTLVSDLDFTALDNGAHTFTDSNSNDWITVNNAVVSNRRYRFHGEVSEWPLAWDPTGTWITTSVTGAGVQKRMERGSSQKSAMRRHHTQGIITDPGAFERFAEPFAYWPMEDLGDSFEVASGLPSKPAMQVYGSPQFAQDTDFNESAPLIKLKEAKLGGRVANNPSGYADIRFMMNVPETIATNSNILMFYASGTTRRYSLDYVGTDSWRLRAFDENDDGSFAWDTIPFSVPTVGELLHCQIILDDDGSNVDVEINVYDTHGELLAQEIDSFLAASLGRVYRINVNDGSVKMNEVFFGHLALYGVDSPTFTDPIGSYHYEAAAERVKRIAAEEQVEFRLIGSASQSALMGYQGVDSPFSIMSSAAVSDGGYLIDPLDAFGVEYRTVRSLLNQSASVTVSYTSNELSGELRPVEDDSYITNDFTASRGGAGGARFRRDTGPLSVELPPDGVGEYSSSQSYSLAHEGQCIDIASWEVHKGTLDEEHYPRIELALENARIAADNALAERILLLDVGNRIDITDTPSFLPAHDIRQIVIGYEETFDNFQHGFKLNTIPERIFETARYDSSDFRFAHDDSTLYQDISTSATSVAVVTNDGPEWSTTAADFDIMVDGEQMTVTAVGPFTGNFSSDTFDRTDSTTTLGNTDGGTAQTWIENSGSWGIQTNRAYITASADSIATIGGAADLELVYFEVPVWTSGAAHVVFRFTDTSNYLRWGGTVGSAAALEQVVAGVATTIVTAEDDQGLFTLAQGDTLAVRCNGSVIECFVNGRMATCVSDTTQESASRVGMRLTTNVPRIDNFYIETSDGRQVFTVTRAVNGVSATHKADAAVSLHQTPYRGL